MKTLTRYINESSNDRMLHDILDIIEDDYGQNAWKNCDIISYDNMIDKIKGIISDYEEEKPFNDSKLSKLKNQEQILVASHNNKASEIVETLGDLADDDILFYNDRHCIFNGENIDVYYQSFNDLKIVGVSEWQNSTEFYWTFFIISNKILSLYNG